MRVIARMKAACPPGIPAWSPARNAAVACAATACSCTSSVLPLEVAPPFRRSLFRANRHRRISPCRPAADAKHSRLRCRRRHCPLPPRGRNAACPAFHIQKPAQIVNYFVDNSCPEFMTILSTSSLPECGVASKGRQWPTSPTATVACGVRAGYWDNEVHGSDASGKCHPQAILIGALGHRRPWPASNKRKPERGWGENQFRRECRQELPD